METFENTNLVNPFERDNDTWAVCYLRRNGDDQNVLKLDNKRLSIVKKGRTRYFDIKEIKEVNKNNKRLLLPLILGGILTPLALLAIYENLFSPFLLLTVFFTGIFLLYSGWIGSHAIVLSMVDGKEEFIFLRSIPKQVLKFIDFFNLFLLKNSQRGNLEFYHVYFPKDDQEDYDLREKRINGYILLTTGEFEEFKSKLNTGFKVIKINPLNLKSPVNLEILPDGSSHFSVQWINPESIL